MFIILHIKKDSPQSFGFTAEAIKNGSKSIPAQLKRQGLAVVAVNYRLSPKAKAPSYLEPVPNR